jgi:hypothetical protein
LFTGDQRFGMDSVVRAHLLANLEGTQHQVIYRLHVKREQAVNKLYFLCNTKIRTLVRIYKDPHTRAYLRKKKEIIFDDSNFCSTLDVISRS